jgi:PAS domain S-box-containing protein
MHENLNIEMFYQSMIEASPNALILVDSRRTIVYANEVTEELFQYSRRELYGQAIELLIPKEYKSRHSEWAHNFIQAAQTRKMGQGRDLFALKKDQSTFPVEIGLTPVHHNNQTFTLATVTDITERKTAEKRTAESEQKLKTTFDILDVGITFTDKQGNILDCNKASEKILGLTKEEILYKNHRNSQWNLIRTDQTPMPPSELASVKALENNQPIRNVETGIVNKSGEIKWLLANAAPLDIEGYGVVITYVDISEQKRTEKHLKASEEILQKFNEELQNKNKAIEQSIDYARKIQYSILPDIKQMQYLFPDIQIFFQPKDTIGGDFFWSYKKDNLSYIAAVDCTGHNVPGAMMTLIINALLNEIVIQTKHQSTGDILSQLHNDLYHYLHQEKGDEYSQDGCDIALCCIDSENKQMQYSGARQDLFLLINHKTERIKANNQSIGGWSMIGTPEPERFFETRHIDLTDAPIIAMATDGITDQLNAEDDAFGRERLTKMLTEMMDLPASEQRKFVAETINQWKQHTSQQDDMLLLALNVPVAPMQE